MRGAGALFAVVAASAASLGGALDCAGVADWTNVTFVEGVPVLNNQIAENRFFFHHVPKTAGSTFQNYFKIKWRHFCRDLDWCKGPTWESPSQPFSDFAIGMDVRENCNLLMYEMDPYNTWHHDAMCRMFKEGFKNLVLLRDPMMHLMSMLTHPILQGHEYDTPQEKLYNITCDFNTVGYQCINPQVTRLTGNPEDASTAISQIQDVYFWVGIAEHFYASLCLLAFQLGEDFESGVIKRESCECSINEKSKGAPSGPRENSNHLVFSYSTHDLKAIASLTNNDRKLYAYALTTFFERIRVMEKHWGIKVVC